MTPIEKVLERFPDARRAGKGWAARCPAHDDRNPSLSIAEGDDGRALVFCHGGCSTDSVCQAKGLSLTDLMPSRSNRAFAAGRDSLQSDGFVSADAAIRFLEQRLGPRSKEWAYYDSAGVHVGSVVRWDGRDGKQVRPVSREEGRWTIGGMQTPRPLYRLPELSTAEVVMVTEGEKAADAAVSLGYVATTSAHGAKSASKTDWSPLAGKEIVVLPDNDAAGARYGEEVVAILARLKPTPTIRVVALPDLPEGGDIADLVEKAGDLGISGLRATIDALVAETQPEQHESNDENRSREDRPTIWIERGDKPRITDQSLAVLAQDHFERGGQLVRCLPATKGDVIVPTTAEAVDDALNRRAHFAARVQDKNAEDGWKERPESAPAWLAKTVIGMQRWPSIRTLDGIHSGPFLRADGSIGGIRSGYDPASRMWIDTAEDWTPLESPATKALVDEAVATLRQLVDEFPFESEVAESVWLAMALTRLARSAFHGPSPLFVIDATTPGSGKTMLARVAGLIVDGRPPGMMSLSDNEEETRKAISSALQEGAGYLVFDNVTGLVDSPTLDRLLTSREWRDRLLGKNQMLCLPNQAVTVITANNASLRADTHRRSLMLRLTPLEERPEERVFKIADLDDYVLRNRRQLLIAAIRILQWYVESGRPRQPICPFGSFEGWSSLVRQAVIHAGLPDPAIRTRVDPTSSAPATFLACWRNWDKKWKGSARHLIDAAFEESSASTRPLREAMLELVGSAKTRDGRPDPQALGNLLGRIQDRNFEGLKVIRSPVREASGYTWQLVEVGPDSR
jgi:hypothetical protein